MRKIERMQRMVLEVSIPGPKRMDEPLAEVERTFLDRLSPKYVEGIDAGRLWQND